MAKVLLFSCLTTIVSAYSFEATNSVYLDRRNTVMFRWAYTEDIIKFEVTMPTIGWVGIGFSPSGKMEGSDKICAWMKNGQPRILDMHATGQLPPSLDAQQNIREYSLTQNGTHTTLFVNRFLDTCDKLHDFAITEDTTRVCFAYGSNVNIPDGDLPTFANYHGNQRGVKSLRLLDKKLPVLHVESGGDLKYIDIRVKPFEIPAHDTYYLCSYHKLPAFEQKQHAVQFEILITPGNEKYLHHVVMYQCNESLVTEDMLNKTEACYIGDDGKHWDICSPVVVAWAVGMTEITFPDHVGYPLGTPGSPKVVKFEVHYDNVDRETGIVDNSGMRIFYTNKLRQYDAGVLMTGHEVGYGLYVPPGSKDFIVHGHCTTQCLGAILEHGGVQSVNVFGVFMHSHTAGRKMVLRHYRNGTELQPIASDLTYDFDFQETKLLAKESTIQTGDNLIMECVYNTMGRSSLTWGGLSTQDEMCFGFVMYYPKLDDAYCQSSPSLTNTMEYFGATNSYEAIYIMMQKKWTDYTREKFNEVQLSAPVKELCRMMSGHVKGLQEPYKITPVEHKYREEHGRCEVEKKEEKNDRTHVLQKRSESQEYEVKKTKWTDVASNGFITTISLPMFAITLCIHLISHILYCESV